jgi:hypothetical protein
MCLPVSRLFWVSSLAYPNLLGTKGYVVVVVVSLPVSGERFPKLYDQNDPDQNYWITKYVILGEELRRYSDLNK